MVFESVFAYLLQKYLGDYIQGLDSKKLKIDFWNGNVVLENLDLKPDALINLNIPMKIRSGHLKSLSLNISWRHLYTHPIQITIDGFYLIVEPNFEVKFNPEQEEKEEYDAKMKEVHKVEEFRKKNEEYENSKKSSKHKDTFLERLELHIIRNLELSVSNIHITFEDKTTKVDHPFIFGINLNFIKLYTTNDQWEYGTPDDDAPVIYKFGEINNLSIYWNSNRKSESNFLKNVIDNFHQQIVQNDQISFENLNYILRPLNIKTQLKIATKTSAEDYILPILNAKIYFEEINLNINRDQYSEVLDLLEVRDYIKLKSKYIKYYSTIKTDNTNLRRWKFAYSAILNEQVRPRLAFYKWENIKENLDRCREYHNLHLKQLNGKLNFDEKQRAQELEKQIDIFNLIFIRRTAELEIKKIKVEQKEQSWWEKLSNWWNNTSNKDNQDFDSDNVMTIDEKKKLYDAIGYKDDHTSSSYPKEYIDMEIAIELNHIEFNVSSKMNENDIQLKVISQLSISNTAFMFKRRPATSDFLVILDIDSLQMFGTTTDDNENRPVLIHPTNQSDLEEQKLFHLEFETNPLNRNIDYRISCLSKSVEIIYHAITINQLIECFNPGVHRHLKSVKKSAYTIFSDIKHQTQFLLNSNLRNLKGLDININIQSCYFLVPENGIYQKESSAICLDSGHFKVQCDHYQIEEEEEEIYEDAQDVVGINDLSYISLKVRLEDLRLIYIKQNEDSKMDLIKPITLDLDIYKLIDVDNHLLPLWKIGAQVSSVDCRLSNTRFFEILTLIRSIPFPESNKSSEDTGTIEEIFLSEGTIPQKDTKKTFEAIESMATAEQNFKEEGDNKTKVSSEEQFIEVEATLDIPRINLIIEESLSEKSDDIQPFIQISFVSIGVRTIMKTFDIELFASMINFIIIHEQFQIDNKPLCLFSTEDNQTLINIKCLFTSSDNPLFSSDRYNRIENKVHVNISKPIAILQIEPILSILRFQKNIFNKLTENQQQLDKFKKKSNSVTDVKKTPVLKMPTYQIKGELEQFRLIIGTEFSQILDIQLQGLIINAFQSTKKTSYDLILNDIRLFDLHGDTRYHNIINQQDHQKQILHLQFSSYYYSKRHKKTLDEVDYDLQIDLAKMNIVLLYKYLDLIFNVLNAFKTKQTKKVNVSSTEINTTEHMIQQFKETIFKIHFDIILNAPKILIPINSHSNEVIFIDLGQLTLKTNPIDDPNRSILEQQILIYKNLLSSRVNLDDNNEMIDQIILLECAQFNTTIDRILQNQSEILVNVEWETIDLTMSNDDYSCIMKIFKQNFSEKISYEIPQFNLEQHSDDEQTNDEEVSDDLTRKKEKDPSDDDQILDQLRFDFQIKRISLTLFVDESNQTSRNENSKFLNLTIEMIEAHFQQLFDLSYNAKAQIQSCFLEDLRETNLPNNKTRLMDTVLNLDQNTNIFIATVQFKQKDQTNKISLRQVNAQLESFYFYLTPDCLMTLKQFFISTQSSDSQAESQPLMVNYPQSPSAVKEGVPLPAKPISTSNHFNQQSTSSERTKPSQSSSDQVSSNRKSDIETRIDVLIKTPEIIWLENTHDDNSNCLVLNFAFQMRMTIISGESHLHGSIKSLTLYGSNFTQLKDSKIQYHILQPFSTDIVLIENSEKQNFDVRTGDIAINIAPAAIRTIMTMVNSIGKLPTTDPDKKEKVNSKSLFEPKPFKDASFWFLEANEINQEMIEQTDILEVTTGIPSHKKALIKEKTKEKKSEIKKVRSEQLIFNTKLIELRVEVVSGSTSKSVISLCLSDIVLDIQNWSSDMNIYSRIQCELALFNDRILAWEPLIEPIVDERGQVISPWCITCSTIHEEDQNTNEYRAEPRNRKKSKMSRLLTNHRESLSNIEEEEKEISVNLKAKSKIHIRAENLLNIIITKTSIDLVQRLLSIFDDAHKQDFPKKDINDDQSILSIHNMTGYEVIIDDITGIQFVKNNESEDSINLKSDESVGMTVPDERLSATHLPAIAEQIAKRRQEFSVKIGKDLTKVDINQTWKRVYDLGPSSFPNWPIQMLCDSQIYGDRRRVILSSIVKIYNRTIMPLIILDVDSIEKNKSNRIGRIEVNEEYYLPIKPLYTRSTSRLLFGIDEGDSDDQITDFISFDWINESTTDRILKTKTNEEIHIVIHKDSIESYSENTDELIRSCFDIYIKLSLHLINLLPLDVQCSIDNDDPVDLKPSELYHSTSGNKKSVLIFTISSYKNLKWISESVDLKFKGHGSHNEYIVQFHNIDTQEIFRMVLRIDTYRESYRASLYSPFWIVNCTNLKLEFKIESDKTLIDTIDSPVFVCPKSFDSELHKKKGHIRLYSIEEDESKSQWSESFSLHVIKSTGITNCKVFNDRNYMVLTSILTSSFGMSKIVTLSSSMSIINKSTIELEIIEIISGFEQDDWKLVKAEEIISFWPRDLREGVLCVRYVHNRSASSIFLMNDKHRTLLQMSDEDRPALHVEVSVNDVHGLQIVFGDYKIGDAPVLLVNCLTNQSVTFSQENESETQVLPSEHYVYYTWIEPFKLHELSISCNDQTTTIKLDPTSGVLGSDDVFYAVFHDGAQTVLIFAEEKSIIESVSDNPSLNELMSQYIEISFCKIGISVINEITQEDLFYITINKSKEIWTETHNSLIKPLSRELNHHLEHSYKTHIRHRKINPNDKKLEEKKYHIDKDRYVSFHENIGEIIDHNGHRIVVERESLDGLYIGYGWSVSNDILHIRINHIQIDDQLEYTMFPVVFHPIVSKAAGTDIPGKPFIELSVFKTTTTRSKTVHFKYFKLLIQEFVFCADQGLIVSILAFIKPSKKSIAPTIDMESDLKRISNPLEPMINSQVENQSKETKIYFDYIHLSPMKIHVSFSTHGTKPSELLLVEYPLAEFLLHLLNIAEVQDVILKLNFYEREKDRFTITKLKTEILTHYEHQLFKQIHVVVLGLDVLGNPFGVIRGVAEGVKSLFYEPYKGAMEGPHEFIEGIASGTEHLFGSAIGGVAGAGSKITGVISKGLATLTFDEDYESARIQRKELTSETTSDVVQSGKNVFKDVVYGVKGVVRKPLAGGKEGGAKGFIKGFSKGFAGLITRPASGVADLTSTSLDLIKRTATQEEVVHRIRHPRHIGRDGIVRPSIAYQMMGTFILNRLDIVKYIKSDDYIAHIKCSENGPGWLFSTSKHLMFVTEKASPSDVYEVEWHFHYKELKGLPIVKFDPDEIEIFFKEPKVLRKMKKDRDHKKTIVCRNIGEARYIVDKITEIMHAMEL